MGIQSKSSGLVTAFIVLYSVLSGLRVLFLILVDMLLYRRGDQRRLSIFKGRHKNGKKDEKSNKEKLKRVSFPPEADAILQDLFTHYPPCDGDTAATSFNKYSGKSGKQGQWNDDFFRKPKSSSQEILEKVASLSSRLRKDKALQEVRNDKALQIEKL